MYRNTDTEQRTRKNDSIDATQDATTHHPRRTENNKKIEKQDIEPKDEKGIDDKTQNCSIDDESGDMVRAQSLKMMWTVK